MLFHSSTRASEVAPQENHGNMSTCSNRWHRTSCVTRANQHFATRASASGTQVSVPDFSQFNCHISVGGRPRGVRISSWPSCASHLSVQTSATTLVGADLGDYDSALSWDSGRRSASPPCRFANESTNTWDPVREAPMRSHPFGETPVRLSQKTGVCMSIEWVCLFTHRPTLDYMYIYTDLHLQRPPLYIYTFFCTKVFWISTRLLGTL